MSAPTPQNAVCEGGPYHGREFSYTGPHRRIGSLGGNYLLTTEENAAGLAIWRWLPREFGTPLPELIPTK